ncbi:MAG: RecX family transcriptional regulator [Bacteroidetes bacterium]|nr:RecX family transcriptional regulator [Bacteroidota bacterium]
MDLLLKAERFCAYQERCRFEVEKKLRELKAKPDEISKIIASLEEDEYLNDERYAKLFASGKFRIKRWGKNKIRAELRIKKMPDDFIQNALNAIDDEEYLKTIQHLIKRKAREVKTQDPKDKLRKIVNNLLSKGFESELIWKCVNLKI